MYRIAKTYECDHCGACQHVDPGEFTTRHRTEEILSEYYDWAVVAPATREHRGLHICPKCAETRDEP